MKHRMVSSGSLPKRLYAVSISAWLSFALAGCGGGSTSLRSASSSRVESDNIQVSTRTSHGQNVDSSPTQQEEESSSATTSRAATKDAWPSGIRRFVQSIHFNNMKTDLSGAIGDEIKAAPASTVAGLAFSPAKEFASQGRWTNALTVLDKCSSRKFILVVHFGHKAISTEMTYKKWGDSFYNEVFASKHDKAYFILSPANEYEGSNFDGIMKELSDEIILDWNNDTKNLDANKKVLPFPYERIRLCKYGISGTRSFNKFTVEGEYHLKGSGEPLGNPATSLPTGYSMVSDDGQTVAYPAYNSNTGGDLSLISAGNYNSYCKGLNASIWLPQLHRWRYETNDSKYHEEGNREDVTDGKSKNDKRRTDMLNTIKAFMKAP